MREQRLLEQGRGDGRSVAPRRDHRDGPDRLTWLHSLTTQYLLDLAPHQGVTTLVLSPHGHIEHALYGVDDGETFWAHTEPGAAGAAVEWLDRMRFMMRVEVADRSDAYAVVWTRRPGGVDLLARAGQDSLGGRDFFVPRDQLAAVLASTAPAGAWASRPGGSRRACRGSAWTATIGRSPTSSGCSDPPCTWRRAATGVRRPWPECTRSAGRPGRLVRLHLDGMADELPAAGSAWSWTGRPLGFVGGSARHYELGPIALGLLKRNVDPDATLVVAGIAASQEILVDPEVGLHVRPSV
jgi:hypothetical protein